MGARGSPRVGGFVSERVATIVVERVEELSPQRLLVYCADGSSLTIWADGRRRDLWLATEPGTTFDLMR